MLSTPETSPWDDPLTVDQSGWLAGILSLGALFILPLITWLMDIYSANFSVHLASCFMVISWGLTLIAGQITSNKLGFILLLVARFTSGATAGTVSLACTKYIFEIAEINIRGTLGVFFVLAINIGILSAYILCPYISYSLSAIIGIVLILLSFVLFSFMPLSPMYWMSRGNKNEAYKSILWLRNNNNLNAKNELQFLENVPILEKGGFRDLLATKSSRQGMLIVFVIAANSQFCGIYAIITFVGFIFKEATGDESIITPYIASILVGSLIVIASYISSVLIDRAGRKILLLISNFFMALCLIVLGLFFYFKNNLSINMENYSYIPILSISIYIIFFAIGIGPIAFVILSELFPQHLREKAYLFGMIIFWGTCFIVGKFFNNLADLMGWSGCYWTFGVICIMSGIFILFELPETKNKSIDEIIQLLDKEKYGNEVKMMMEG